MRKILIAFALAASAATGALAQSGPQPIERRVGRLEQEMRAVQRRVFPGGQPEVVEPEIRPVTPPNAMNDVSGDALASLAERVDALEAQLRAITGQVEEQGHRTAHAADATPGSGRRLLPLRARRTAAQAQDVRSRTASEANTIADPSGAPGPG